MEKKVKDLVTPLTDYPHLPYWATLKEAFIQLSSALESGINTVLVFNEAYRLVGILSPADILRGIEPKFAQHYEEGVPVFWSDLLAGSVSKKLMSPIKEFMTPARAIIESSDDILKASHLMLTENQEILVVQEKGKIIGVVTLTAILQKIIEVLIDRE